MLDIQLSPDYEKKLEQIALSENVPTSEFIGSSRIFVENFSGCLLSQA